MRFTSDFFSKALNQQVPFSSSSIITDSRQAGPDQVFVALKGERFDGHDFVFQALEKGCSGAVVEIEFFKKAQDTSRLIAVKNTTDALRELARTHRQRLNAKIFVVGGSNGKTTTKEWIAFLTTQLLGSEMVFKTKKSENSILGVAMSLLQIRDEKIAILEVGIDEPGWMEKHLELIDPDAGLITTIQEEHLERLKSIENVAKEELKLLEFLRKKKGGFAANLDCSWIRNEELPEESLTYSLESRADIEGLFQPIQYLHAFGLAWKNPLPGKHNAQNLLAALAAQHLLIPDLDIQDFHKLHAQIQHFEGEAHRSRCLELPNQIRVYDDCYNANPSSMESALKTFQDWSEGQESVVVLGDMLDLGEHTEAAHKRILNLALVFGFNEVVLFGPHFQKAYSQSEKPKNLKSFIDFSDLQAYLEKRISGRQTIMLKASRGMRLERLLSLWEK